MAPGTATRMVGTAAATAAVACLLRRGLKVLRADNMRLHHQLRLCTDTIRDAVTRLVHPFYVPMMPKRTLGSSGLQISVISLGGFAFGGDRKTGTHLGSQMAALHEGIWGHQRDEDTFATIKAALDLGVNLFDNSEMYGDGYAEEVMGRALKASGYERSSYHIATKVSEAFLEPALLRQHLEASLRRLGVDYIDLYQIHWASRAAVRTDRYPQRPLGAEVPLEATLAALDECRRAGLIRHIGVCNFGVGDLQRALGTGVPIVSNQLCYHLLWRGAEDEVMPFCAAHNIAILPWSPLAQGLLTGKMREPQAVPAGRARSRLFSSSRPQQRHGEPGLERETFAALDKFAWMSERLGAPMANVALAWLKDQPGVCSVLMGARTPAQLRRNLDSLALHLEPAVLSLLRDAGEEIKRKLGPNLDCYEGAATSRIR